MIDGVFLSYCIRLALSHEWFYQLQGGMIIKVIDGVFLSYCIRLVLSQAWFYQLQGGMIIKVIDGGIFRDIILAEGECILLPARVPHSPQRVANTMG